jgi:hypothetical protein
MPQQSALPALTFDGWPEAESKAFVAVKAAAWAQAAAQGRS